MTFISNLSPGTPTVAQRAESTALQRQGAAALAGYRAFLDLQVRPLNEALRAAGLAPVDLNAVPARIKPDPNADEHARRGAAHD